MFIYLTNDQNIGGHSRYTVNVFTTGTECYIKGESSQRPRLTILSFASRNDAFSAPRPALLHWAIMNAYNYVYADIAAAEGILLSNKSLLATTLVQPPLIVDAEYITSTTSVIAVVSYEDLVAVITKLCMEPETTGTSYVGIISNNSSGSLYSLGAWQVPRNMLIGFAGRFIPGFWGMHRFIFGI